MIEINAQWRAALKLMEETKKHVLLTGKAGTGKSTLLKHFRQKTKKSVVVLAPTGVAAVNIGGQTIHSFFGFKPDIAIQKIKSVSDERMLKYEKLETIVIDEISMVRADLLDCIDRFLRLNGPIKKAPFGGVQLICIGDLYQLPPVVTRSEQAMFSEVYDSPYFFSAHVLVDGHASFHYIELQTIYRQKDEAFIHLLNTIRNNSATAEDLVRLNARVQPYYVPPDDNFYITLTTTNALADEVNTNALYRLDEKEEHFVAKIDGEVKLEQYPAADVLYLKVGAQIMMLNNDLQGRWVNGTMGKILSFGAVDGEQFLRVLLETGEEVSVEKNSWEIYEYHLDEKKQLEAKVVGTFMQYPLRLAFAITIHKSQGKTFQHVVIDIGTGVFAYGQLYVALSRCTNLEGIILRKPILQRHIMIDSKVRDYVKSMQGGSIGVSSSKGKLAVLQEAIEAGKQVHITYLTVGEEKSRRRITPYSVDEVQADGIVSVALSAYCHVAEEECLFQVERILQVQMVDD